MTVRYTREWPMDTHGNGVAGMVGMAINLWNDKVTNKGIRTTIELALGIEFFNHISTCLEITNHAPLNK